MHVLYPALGYRCVFNPSNLKVPLNKQNAGNEKVPSDKYFDTAYILEIKTCMEFSIDSTVMDRYCFGPMALLKVLIPNTRQCHILTVYILPIRISVFTGLPS